VRRLAKIAVAAAVALATAASLTGPVYGAPRMGPLAVSETNGRYFERPDGRVVLLTGSHVWENLVDRGTTSPPPAFEFGAYLDVLSRNGHTFIRLWAWELPQYRFRWEPTSYSAPHPWPRTGPGLALDGLPRFDLSRFDESYFQRRRDRVAVAQARGMYVSVMLFEGYGLQFAEEPYAWLAHPLNAANNVNGVNGDADGDGAGHETHALASSAVWGVQRAYVRKVVDTVNRFDNVLYEIANESSSRYSTPWQHRLIREIKRYERAKPKQHPVGMTFQWEPGSNAALYASGAHWVAPSGGAYWLHRPPRSDGRKVVVSDTDHHCGHCVAGADFVWKNVLQGHNPIYMDPLDDEPGRAETRLAMGDAARWTRRLGLKASLPRPRWSSTGYLLARPGERYLAYQPGSGAFRLRFPPRRRTYSVLWFDPLARATLAGGTMRALGWRTLTPPFAGPAVALLLAR
jgi:hypothetical protein